MAYTLNVKGVFNRNRLCATVGGILKKNNTWVRGIGGNIGLAVPETAELWAIFYGLKMAWEQGITSVVVLSESMEAINAVKNPDPMYNMAMLVNMITSLLLGEAWTFVDIVPTYADVNTGATALANYYIPGPGGVEDFAEPPAGVNP